MPLPRNRSTSVRKVFRRTPRGGSAIHYSRRPKGKFHTCPLCGSRLQAVSSSRKLPGSARAPNRMYGGNLCSACASRVLVLRNRLKEGAIQLPEVEVRMLRFVRQ